MSSTFTILHDFVPLVHKIRADLNLDNNAEEARENEEILKVLQSLECSIQEYDDLELVRRLKALLSSRVNKESDNGTTPSPFAPRRALKNLGSQSGIDNVRRVALEELKEAVDSFGNSDSRLGETQMTNVSSRKKKRSSGYFTSIDFDNLPDFEPLELTLAVLRSKRCDEFALTKLLGMDIGELVGHMQWMELVSLLKYSLSEGDDRTKILSLQVHTKLVCGLQPPQNIDIVFGLLQHFMDVWMSECIVSPRGGTVGISSIPTDTFDTLTVTRIAAFTAIVKIVPFSVLDPTLEKDCDRIISTIFFLLARGSIRTNSSSSVVTGDAYALLDVMAAVSTEYGESFEKLVVKWHSLAVLSHAVHSGLLGCINDRLLTSFDMLVPAAVGDIDFRDPLALFNSFSHVANAKVPPEQLEVLKNRILLDGRIWLSLLSPIAHHRSLRRFCCVLSATKSSPAELVMYRAQYSWDGKSESREDYRFQGSDLGEVIAVVATSGMNNILYSMSGARSILEWVQNGRQEGAQGAATGSDLEFDLMVSKLSFAASFLTVTTAAGSSSSTPSSDTSSTSHSSDAFLRSCIRLVPNFAADTYAVSILSLFGTVLLQLELDHSEVVANASLLLRELNYVIVQGSSSNTTVTEPTRSNVSAIYDLLRKATQIAESVLHPTLATGAATRPRIQLNNDATLHMLGSLFSAWTHFIRSMGTKKFLNSTPSNSEASIVTTILPGISTAVITALEIGGKLSLCSVTTTLPGTSSAEDRMITSSVEEGPLLDCLILFLSTTLDSSLICRELSKSIPNEVSNAFIWILNSFCASCKAKMQLHSIRSPVDQACQGGVQDCDESTIGVIFQSDQAQAQAPQSPSLSVFPPRPPSSQATSRSQTPRTPREVAATAAATATLVLKTPSLAETKPLLLSLLTIIDAFPNQSKIELLASQELTSLLNDIAVSADIWGDSETLPLRDVLHLLQGLALMGKVDLAIDLCCLAWPSLQELIDTITVASSGGGTDSSTRHAPAVDLSAYIISAGDMGSIECEGFASIVLRVLTAGLTDSTFSLRVKMVYDTIATTTSTASAGAASVVLASSDEALLAEGLSATTVFALAWRRRIRGSDSPWSRLGCELLCHSLGLANEERLERIQEKLRGGPPTCSITTQLVHPSTASSSSSSGSDSGRAADLSKLTWESDSSLYNWELRSQSLLEIVRGNAVSVSVSGSGPSASLQSEATTISSSSTSTDTDATTVLYLEAISSLVQHGLRVVDKNAVASLLATSTRCGDGAIDWAALSCLLVLSPSDTEEYDVTKLIVNVLQGPSYYSIDNLVTTAVTMVVNLQGDSILNIFSSIGISLHIFVRTLLHQWFYGFLSAGDTKLLTARCLLFGAHQASSVAAAIACIVARDLFYSPSDDVNLAAYSGVEQLLMSIGQRLSHTLKLSDLQEFLVA